MRQSLFMLASISCRRNALISRKNGAMIKHVETASKKYNLVLTTTLILSAYMDNLLLLPLLSILYGEVDAVKCVSIQHYSALVEFNDYLMEFQWYS